MEKYKEILKSQGAISLRIKARPGQNRTGFVREMPDASLAINLRAKAEDGRANDELLRFLAKELAVGAENIKILKGKTSRQKIVRIKI